MSERVFNFSAGPAMLPRPVLEASARALLDFRGSGTGIAEISHRSQEFESVLDEAITRCRQLLDVPHEFDVLFLQGGATQLFTTIPMNFLRGSAEYVVSGEWSSRAAKAARPYGDVIVPASSEDTGFDRVPRGWQSAPEASYLHICANETITGTRWSSFPKHPYLVADASSELMSRPYEMRNFALVYGGAQKNLGPAGVVLAIVRRDLYERIPPSVPEIFHFGRLTEARSLLNTPPTFGIYMLLETFRWLEQQGGVMAMEARNERKASMLYAVVDEMPDFYCPVVTDVENRSRMNVTFRLPTEELTRAFLNEAEAGGMVGLKGYRTVGGVRASIYNAMPLEGCERLAEHMRSFALRHR